LKRLGVSLQRPRKTASLIKRPFVWKLDETGYSTKPPIAKITPMATKGAEANRAGRFITQSNGGYRAFVPAPLPPDPPIELDEELVGLLSDAQIELGRLDGAIKVIPDPDFFVGMYVRREAVLSSQIEGTQSTLEDLLEVELNDANGRGSDVMDIVNYVSAMNYGLDRLQTLPLSLRLIREIHGELLQDGRGAQATPGEFRRTQNWIGPSGASLSRATFVPPPVPEMKTALGDFEKFLHAERLGPVLVDVGLAHAQFETIHPFLDGNGRIGRLLITLLLVHSGILRKPLLYLSYYFKLHRTEYYDRLMAVRLKGDWEAWIRFFLSGVVETAQEATMAAERIFELRERHRALILNEGLGSNGLLLLSALFQRPLVNVKLASNMVDVAFPTANKLVSRFEQLGLLREVTGRRRGRIFRYDPYIDLFDDPAYEDPEQAATETTESPAAADADSDRRAGH
jgi:Fic family protein